MPETPPLSPRDYDPLQLASPRQLLELLKRLGVEGRVISRWLGVKEAAVSQWTRDRRTIPPRYGPALLVWTRHALEQAQLRNAKEVAIQPTEALQRAVQAELAALWDRWKLEVLAGAGTLERTIQQQYESLGKWIMQDQISPTDGEDILFILDHLKTQVELLMSMKRENANPEAEVHARLTAAHEAAARTYDNTQP